VTSTGAYREKIINKMGALGILRDIKMRNNKAISPVDQATAVSSGEVISPTGMRP
jgi:hypothetical protein